MLLLIVVILSKIHTRYSYPDPHEHAMRVLLSSQWYSEFW